MIHKEVLSITYFVMFYIHNNEIFTKDDCSPPWGYINTFDPAFDPAFVSAFVSVRNGDPGKFFAFSKILSAVSSSEVGNPNL